MGLSLKLSDVAFVLSSIEGRCGGNQFARNWHSNDTEILGLWGEERGKLSFKFEEASVVWASEISNKSHLATIFTTLAA